ncbi:MAG TPA: MFS transporter, partial [Candidatus Binataceae bacterium]
HTTILDRGETPTLSGPEVEAAPAGPDSIVADDIWSGRLAAFRAFRHRNFRLFFGGQFTSVIGTWMQRVAQAWLVLKLTNSSMWLGLVSFSTYMPIVITGVFAGAIVDHSERRQLLVVTQSLLMTSAFVLAALTWAGVVRVEHVMILAVFNGLVSSFDMPGRQSFVVEMVGREDLPNAIAMNSMIFNGARMIGPAFAGVLIAVSGVAGCFFLNGVSYLAVIWSLLAMKLPRLHADSLLTAARESGLGALAGTMLTRVREGLHYTWRHRASFYLLVLVSINSGFAIQYTVLLPLFARNLLHSGPKGYGLLMTAQGLGAVLSAVAMNTRGATARNLRQNLTFGIFCTAAGIFLLAVSQWMALAMAAQMLVGIGLMNHMVTTNTMLQLFVSDELRGRVMSLYSLSIIGMAPLGSLEVGFVGSHFGPRIAVAICSMVALACGVFLVTRLKLFAAAQARQDLLSAEES